MESVISKINNFGNPSSNAWNALRCVIDPGSKIRAVSINLGLPFFYAFLSILTFQRLKMGINPAIGKPLTAKNKAEALTSL